MTEPKSRLENLSDIILNITNKNGTYLNLAEVPDSKLELSANDLKSIPGAFRGDVDATLVYGLDYFSPGMKAVILGGKNDTLSYIAASRVVPGGCIINCFSDPTHMEKLQLAYCELPREQLPELQFYYTPNGELATRYPEIETFLKKHTVKKTADYLQLDRFISEMRSKNPLIEDNSVDIVALDSPNFDIAIENLWDLAEDVYRILKKGGIFLFSLLLSDEKADEEGYLWEGHMERFTQSLKFHGLYCLGRSELPYLVTNGKEIRYHNFAAFKGKEGACMDRRQAVIYNGPWREIKDDDGHTFPRGKRVAVCDKTFNVLSRSPYKAQFTYLQPYIEVPLEQATPFPCTAGILFRNPKETKGIEDSKPASQDCCSSTGKNESSDACGCNGSSCC